VTDLAPGDADRDPSPPGLSLLFGYGPMLPIVAAAIAGWTLPRTGWPIACLGLVWAAAILLFLAGVRRGLAFRTPGGERIGEMATMIWLFLLGLAALVAIPLWGAASAGLLAIGYASVAILDPIAALREEAPAHFARLRPPQMALGLCGILALMALFIAPPGV
jgi:hypothetical protein